MIQGMEGTARAVLVGETETNGPYLSVLLHAAVEWRMTQMHQGDIPEVSRTLSEAGLQGWLNHPKLPSPVF